MKSWLALTVIAVAGCGDAKEPAPRALVSNEADGTVSVIDLQRLEVTSTIRVGGTPRDVRIAPSGETAYVADGATGRIQVVDLEAEEILRALNVGADPTAYGMINISIIVANGAAGTASIVDASAGTTRAAVHVGGHPTAVAPAPDETVWVACADTDAIDVIDTAYSENILSIPVGDHPSALVFARAADYAYVANEAAGTISVIDLEERKAVKTIVLPAPAAPIALALGHDDDRLYVANSVGSVDVIDTRTTEVVDVIALPGAQPRSLTLGGDDRIYVASAITDDLSVIDPGTGAVVARIDVGRMPASVEVEH